LDRHLALLVREQPGPSAAELADGSLLKLLLERVVAAERALDGVAQPARRGTAAAGAHGAPEGRWIGVAAGVGAGGAPVVPWRWTGAARRSIPAGSPRYRVDFGRKANPSS